MSKFFKLGNKKEGPDYLSKEDKKAREELLKNDPELGGFLDAMADMIKQSMPQTEIDQMYRHSEAVYEIGQVLKRFKIHDVQQIVHLFVMYMAVPILTTEPNKELRTNLMMSIGNLFAREVLSLISNDLNMDKQPESGELVKLRNMMKQREIDFFKQKLSPEEFDKWLKKHNRYKENGEQGRPV